MSAFSVENPHDGKTFENYTRFEWGVEVGVVTTFMLRLFVPHDFYMICGMFLWSQTVLSLKLIVGFGYIFILDYFSVSTVVGCSLIYSFAGFHFIELETLIYFCRF